MGVTSEAILHILKNIFAELFIYLFLFLSCVFQRLGSSCLPRFIFGKLSWLFLKEFPCPLLHFPLPSVLTSFSMRPSFEFFRGSIMPPHFPDKFCLNSLTSPDGRDINREINNRI